MKSSTMNNCYAYKNMFNAAAESGPKLFIGNLSHTSEFLATAIPFPRLSTIFHNFPSPMPDSRTVTAWKNYCHNGPAIHLWLTIVNRPVLTDNYQTKSGAPVVQHADIPLSQSAALGLKLNSSD